MRFRVPFVLPKWKQIFYSKDSLCSSARKSISYSETYCRTLEILHWIVAPISFRRMKHIDAHHFYSQSYYKAGIVTPRDIASAENSTDGFTKPLNKD